jgi:hypothetical protein
VRFRTRARLILCAALWLCAGRAQAEPITLQERNLGALNNALLMTTSMLEQVFGLSIAALPYRGTFNDSSWSAELAGNYASMAVNLTFSGLFDSMSQQGAFTATGTVGTAAWDERGLWSFADLDPDTVEMSWESAATVQLASGLTSPDRRGNGPTFRRQMGDLVIIQDFGFYRKTLFGVPLPFTGEFRIESETIRRGDQASVSIHLPDDLAILTGSADFVAGTTSGTIQVVPEPSTLALLGGGLMAARLLRRRSAERVRRSGGRAPRVPPRPSA